MLLAPVVERQLEFETLISNVSAQLLAAPESQIDRAVNAALADVRVFFEADRCALIALDPQAGAVVSHLACAEGVAQVPGTSPPADFPWSHHRLVVEHEPTQISRMADLPAEAAADRASFERMGIRSNLAIPILAGAAVSHLIVVHNVGHERAWPAAFVPRLRLLGEMVVNALRRKQGYLAVTAALDELRESEARFRTMANTAPVFIWMAGRDKLCTFCNKSWLEFTGRTAEQEMGNGWAEGIHPDDQSRSLEVYTRAFDARQPFTMECRVRRAGGEYGWVLDTGVPRFAADGTFLGYIGSCVDITPQKQTQAALLQREDQYRQVEVDLRRSLEEVQRLRDRLQQENVYLLEEAKQRQGSELVVGKSSPIRKALGLASQVAATPSTVLLLGETGTGKERFATLIHESGRRRAATMIRVNCAAIPSALIESELFGREKGAYTGALSKQVGRFELAHGSTLFLDEIGDLPAEIQVKLLRVLEERTIERLGNPRPVAVDVRIIAATNRNLEQLVEEGTFRRDLYYRLNVFPITVPPLRERTEDIPLLVSTFVGEFSAAMGKRIEKVTPESMEALFSYPWPGNVRELRNVVERAMILVSGPALSLSLPAPNSPSGHPAPEGTGLKSVERTHILRVLEATGWRIRGPLGAASRLGLPATTLEARMKKLSLRRPGAPS